jgi:hypothetical protein
MMDENRSFHIMRLSGRKITLCGQTHLGYMRSEAQAAIRFDDYRNGDRHIDHYRSVCARCEQIFGTAKAGIYRADGRLY